MADQEKKADGRISQSDTKSLQKLLSLLKIDVFQMSKAMDEVEHKDREQMGKGYNSLMRSERRRLKSFVTYDHFASWIPQEMAATGFYFTGVKNGVQCFCCGLILFRTKLTESPHEHHQKFQPDCGFLLGKEVGNISKYAVRVQHPEDRLRENSYQYQEEKVRLESFKNWPFYVEGTSPIVLSAAGFVFTGKKDFVQCFSCGGCLGNWEEGDDPWKEHAKWFPTCEFLQNKKSPMDISKYIQSYKGFVGVMGKHFTTSWMRREYPMEPGTEDQVPFLEKEEKDVPSQDYAEPFPEHEFLLKKKAVEEMSENIQSHEIMEKKSGDNLEGTEAIGCFELTDGGAQWLSEAKNLNDQLKSRYTSVDFQNMSWFEEGSPIATDFQSLYCDPSIVSKDINNHLKDKLILPEVLSSLNSITCIEGVTGSGKTTLLKKIALLWASGECALLERFCLVFYLSLHSTKPDQGIAEIISEQLLQPKGSITEMSLRKIIKELKEQVLFLVDDYSEMNSAPAAIEKLIQKNHSNKTCLVISVCTHRTKNIRQYLDTVLEITAFPLYNSFYILGKLFSHHPCFIEKFFIHMAMNESLKGILKTPLITVAFCALVIQKALYNLEVSEEVIFEGLVHYHYFKNACDTRLLTSTMSACGSLALKGLFRSCFEFSEDDLLEASISEGEALHLGLIIKLTAQRLQPVYQFFHPFFQEFLAGMRIIELLDSDRQEDQDMGLDYLKQINTYRKVVGPYHYFLKYATSFPSTKAGPMIVCHLLQLVDSRELLESQSEDNNYLKQHPELSMKEDLIKCCFLQPKEIILSVIRDELMTLAIQIAYRSNTLTACAPSILQFLRGKTLSLKLLASRFFLDYPESLSVINRIEISLNIRKEYKTDFAALEASLSFMEIPPMDEQYAPAFETVNELKKRVGEEEKNINSFLKLLLPRDLIPTKPIVHLEYIQRQYKIPLLDIQVCGINTLDKEDLRKLKVAISASERVQLALVKCPGLVESIWPAIEEYKDCFTKCTIEDTELSVVEQEILLSISSLESLKVTGITEHLFSNLDKLPHLKELSLNLSYKSSAFDIIPEGFQNFHQMEKLMITMTGGNNASKIVKLIQNNPNLLVLHLNCSQFLDFEALMDVLVFCKKLVEIKFTGWFLKDIPFVTALANFTSLKILDLQDQEFTDKKTSEKFAQTLGFLNNLEELILPHGEAIHHAAKLIIQQCSKLPHLRILSFMKSLNDDGLMEIANASINGGFQKLENLILQMNFNITEDGWRNFFQRLDNMPNLTTLNINSFFTHPIKAHATTVKSLSQCVSKLPALLNLFMYGWFIDDEDSKMLNDMKEKHPQSKHLLISWRWTVAHFPIIQK